MASGSLQDYLEAQIKASRAAEQVEQRNHRAKLLMWRSPFNKASTKITFPSPCPGMAARNFPLHVSCVRAFMERNGVFDLRSLYDRRKAGTLVPLTEHQYLVESLKTYDRRAQDKLWRAN